MLFPLVTGAYWYAYRGAGAWNRALILRDCAHQLADRRRSPSTTRMVAGCAWRIVKLVPCSRIVDAFLIFVPIVFGELWRAVSRTVWTGQSGRQLRRLPWQRWLHFRLRIGRFRSGIPKLLFRESSKNGRGVCGSFDTSLWHAYWLGGSDGSNVLHS